MSAITDINENPATPTTCHLSFVQFYVQDNKLYMDTKARSQDILLGTPHNWVQAWALLVYLAAQTGYDVGNLEYSFGDAHVYAEESHMEVADSIIAYAAHQDSWIIDRDEVELIYTGNVGDEFKASDFQVVRHKNFPPVSTVRPKLL
jgi:thymidylate synthase